METLYGIRDFANANGYLDSTTIALALDKGVLENRCSELEAHLAAMRSSRFWKARNGWFVLKRALRLTDEL